MLLFGGGGRSASVADVPDNIKKMIGQYKKIAYINSFSAKCSYWDQTPVKIGSVNFIPSKIFATVESIGYVDGGVVYDDIRTPFPISKTELYMGQRYVLNLSNKNKDIYLNCPMYGSVGEGRIFHLKDIVAIE